MGGIKNLGRKSKLKAKRQLKQNFGNFLVDLKTMESIDEEKILDNGEGILKEINHEKVYEPDLEIHKMKIDHSLDPLQEGKGETFEVKKGTMKSVYDNYDNFMQFWRNANDGKVVPFYATGFDSKNPTTNEIGTTEYEFMIKDDFRFPSEFQSKKMSTKGKIKKHLKKKRRSTKIPNELDWRDYGK